VSSVPSRKILHWATAYFSEHAITQPCRCTTGEAFQAVKGLRDILNLQCCKCARMRFHCASGLVVLRSAHLRTFEGTLIVTFCWDKAFSGSTDIVCRHTIGLGRIGVISPLPRETCTLAATVERPSLFDKFTMDYRQVAVPSRRYVANDSAFTKRS